MTARKVMLLGEIGVGKSSIARRLVLDRFDFDYKPTIGVDVYLYEVPDTPGRERMTLIIWDTDGNFGESIFRHVYVKQATAALIVGDVTRRSTLDTMLALGSGFSDALPGRYCGFILNKIDLIEEKEPPVLPQGLAGVRVPLARTSAKTGSNVKEAFHAAAAAILRRGH